MAPKISPMAEALAQPPAFERSLAELEALVTQLESGDLPLEQALSSFEQGVRLTRECQDALSAAQQKVQLLRQRGDTTTLEEFSPLSNTDGTGSDLSPVE